MKEYRAELLAKSLAGHDKDQIYVVIKEEEEFFWLADGKRRLLESPKKKKQKHVQIIKHLPEDVKEQMNHMTLDAHVRNVIKQYTKNQDNED